MNTAERTPPAPRGTVQPLRTALSMILKNGVWLTLPPLLFSLGLMTIIPSALTTAEFNKGIPPMLLIGENIVRILTFAIPLIFTIGVSSKGQRRGLVFYLLGVGFYFLSYGTQNYFPESLWSTSFIGFIGSAFLNIFWMIGLAMMGQKFNFRSKLVYSPIYYIIPVILFIIVHTIHASLYYQMNF